MKKKRKTKRDRTSSILWGLVAVLAILACLPLLHYGLCNSDDLINYILSGEITGLSSLWRKTYEYFLTTGRLTHLLTGWSLFLPYMFHSRVGYLLVSVVPIILDLVLSVVLVRQYTDNRSVTLLAALFIFCFFTITTGFSATAGYPFWFSFSFLILLLSIWALLRYKRCQKYAWLLLSALLMFVATLFYETYLMYYIIIYLMLRATYSSCPFAQKETRRTFAKELLPFILGGLVFIIAYYITSASVPIDYAGNKWAHNPLQSLRSWGNIILYSIPGMSVFQYRIALADLSADPQYAHNFIYLLTHAGASAWAKGLLAVILFYGIMQHFHFKTNSRKLWLALGISVAAATLPHLLLCCSQKYVTYIPDSYVTSLLSNIGMSFTFLVIYLLIWHYLSNWPIVRKIFNGCLAVVLLTLTVLIQFTNEQIMQDIRRSNLQYTQAKAFLDKQEIHTLGENVWTGRFQLSPTKTGKMIISDIRSTIGGYIDPYGHCEPNYAAFYNKYHASDEEVAVFAYQQAAKSDDMFFIWFQCKGTDLTEDFTQIACDSIQVGYYSSYNSFALSLFSEQDSCEVSVNGHPLQSVSNAHYGNIRFLNMHALKNFTITGKDLLPSTLSISNILYPNLTPVFFGKFTSQYYKDAIRYYRHEIWKNRPLEMELERVARERGVDPQEHITGNADWMLLYLEPY